MRNRPLSLIIRNLFFRIFSWQPVAHIFHRYGFSRLISAKELSFSSKHIQLQTVLTLCKCTFIFPLYHTISVIGILGHISTFQKFHLFCHLMIGAIRLKATDECMIFVGSCFCFLFFVFRHYVCHFKCLNSSWINKLCVNGWNCVNRAITLPRCTNRCKSFKTKGLI